MRKSKRPPLHPNYFLLRDVLPERVKWLRSQLKQAGEMKLAEQVLELRIYGRCPCGSPPCGTFYCVPPDEYRRLSSFERTIGMAEVSAAKNRITRVETRDPKVDEVLDRLFPGAEF